MSLYQNTLDQIEDAAQIMDLDTNVKAILEYPERMLQVSIPVKMDDGSTKVFEGYRVQHSTVRGPAKGGLRYAPEVDIDEVKALAAWMSMKTAVIDLPLGGGKGGVTVNTKDLSEAELERLSRGFIEGIAPIIGPNHDVPAPDMYTNPKIMAWMADEYSRLKGENQLGVITGKPLEVGGSVGRGTATAQGGVYVLNEYVKVTGADVKTVVVQGFGNAGSYAAEILSAQGMNVIAVSDSRGGIYNPNGIDVAKAQQVKADTRSLAGYDNAEQISNADILALECDVLVLAARENEVCENGCSVVGNQIQAKIVLELANGPIKPDADKVLAEKGVIVIPDILANAGGVTVSYFEQVQNNANFYWNEDEVQTRLKAKMEKGLHDVLAAQEKYSGITLRQAAFVVAMGRLANTLKARGRV